MFGEKEANAPVPIWELAPSMLLSGIMIAFTMTDLGVCRRATSGEANDLQFAEFYFGTPVPIKSTVFHLIAPSILLLVPKLVMDDIVPLYKGSQRLDHYFGVFVLVMIFALMTTGGASLGPRLEQAGEHFFDKTDAEEVGSILGRILWLAAFTTAGLLARAWAKDAAHRERGS